MTLLNTLNGNGSTSLFDISSITNEYTYYKIMFDNLTPEDAGAFLQAQFYINGNFASDNQYSVAGNGIDQNGAGSFTGIFDFMQLYPQNRQGPLSGGVYGELNLLAPLEPNVYKCYTAQLIAPMANDSQVSISNSGGSYLGNTNAITGIQFLFSSGNIQSGIIRIYGWV